VENYYANQLQATQYYTVQAPDNPADTRGGATHSDIFQFNTGKNVEIRHSLLGGRYLITGLGTQYDPGPLGMLTPGGQGSVVLAQQEQDNRYPVDVKLVDGIYIHDNWLMGADATVNVFYKTHNNPANTLPAPGVVPGRIGNRIVNNRVATRTGGNASGLQVWKSSQMQTDLSGNVAWDWTTGEYTGPTIYGTGQILAPVVH
jgi:hypothetical protein